MTNPAPDDREDFSMSVAANELSKTAELDRYINANIQPALVNLIEAQCIQTLESTKRLNREALDHHTAVVAGGKRDSEGLAEGVEMRLDENLGEAKKQLETMVRQLVAWMETGFGLDTLAGIGNSAMKRFEPGDTMEVKAGEIEWMTNYRACSEDDHIEYRRETVIAMMNALETQTTDPATQWHYLKKILIEKEDW